jgi:hypothetical protein
MLGDYNGYIRQRNVPSMTFKVSYLDYKLIAKAVLEIVYS